MSDDPQTRSRPYVAAGALFFNEAGRIMLVRPTYKEYWDIPGGYLDNGETPSEAASREVKEELGIDVEVGQLLVVDWAPNPQEGDKLLFVFDGGTLGKEQAATIHLQADELAELAFFESAVAEQLLIPRLARRIMAAVSVRRSGVTTYLEHRGTTPLDGFHDGFI